MRQAEEKRSLSWDYTRLCIAAMNQTRSGTMSRRQRVIFHHYNATYGETIAGSWSGRTCIGKLDNKADR